MTAHSRIIIAGEFWHGASDAGLAHGFRQLGWEVAEVDMREHLIQGRQLALRAAARLLRGASVRSYNRAVLDEVEAARPSVFLTVKGSFLTPATLAAIRARGVMTVNYYPDYHFNYPGLDQATFPHYDLFVTTKSFQVPHLVRLLGENRVRFVHHGYSTLVHRPFEPGIVEEDYIADVLYVGNHTSYKERWLAAVAQALPGAKLMIVGNRWEDTLPGAQHVVKSGAVSGDRYARILRRARINVAIHAGPSGPLGWEDLTSTRTFEIPACKGFMLHIGNEEVRTLFEPGAEIDVFSTADELCGKIRYYLERPELRREMADRAYLRCVPAYSYDMRAAAIAEELGALRNALQR